jgi:hypothetical protein
VSKQLSETEYCCPGENYAISRAVHLARLDNYYAACRDCPRREDTTGLSARHVRRLAELHSRPRESSRLGPGGIRVPINDVSPPLARAIAIQFARQVLNQVTETRPAIVFASDGRLSTTAIVAAVVEGIRWAGCEAIDLGAASAPCTARAIEHLDANGGIYLGDPDGAAHKLGMKFWIGRCRTNFYPALDEVESTIGLIDRPVRAFGPLRRIDAAEGYLNELRPAYHAFRPLRFVLRCSCEPVVTYLNDLLQTVACRVIPAEPDDFGGQVVAAKAHFGMEISDDGETGRVFDEHGRAVANRLKSVIAAETDALRTLTHLLVLLSRDDMAFSAVLDRAGNTR